MDKASLSFTAQQGGPPVTQPLNVSGSSSGLAFNVTSNASWLRVSPASGSTPSTLTVTADPAGLGPGTVAGVLTIFSFSTIQVQVTLTVGPVAVTPQSLQVAYSLTGTIPAAQTLNIAGQAVAFSAAATTTDGKLWLQVAPTSGQTPASLSVIFNSQVLPTLAAGTYSGAINITAGTQSIAVPVTLTVTSAPAVTANPTSLVFNFQTGQATPATQNITVTVSPAQQLTFTLASTVTANPAGKNWIVVVPSGISAANGTAVFSIAVDPSGLPANTYTGNIALTSQGTPSVVNIPVTLVVSNLPLLNVPSTTLNFLYQVGGTVPAPQPATVTATSGTPSFLIAASSVPAGWLKVPASGTVPAPFNVAVDPTGLAKGVYSGTVTVTGQGTGNGAQTFPVTLTVTNDPVISALVGGCNAPSQFCVLSIPFQIGGTTNPGATPLTVNSSTGATLNYTVTPSTSICGNWLLVNGGTAAVNGATSSGVSISAATTGIAAGTTCTGTITIAATNPATGLAAPNSPVTILVILTVSSTAQLVVTPNLGLTFSAPAGGTASSPQVINLSSTGSDQLNYTVAFTPDLGGNWLSLNTAAGVTPGSILATATPSSLLAAGTYTGSLKITATGAGGPSANATVAAPFVIPVTLQLTAGTLAVSPSALTFTQTLGGAAPATQALQITSNGQALNYSAAASNTGSVAWLSVTGNTTGQTPGSVTVAADGSRLSPGSYQGTVTVTAPGASNTGLQVPVTLTVASGTIGATPATLSFTQTAGGTAPAAQTVAVSGPAAPLGFTVATSTKDGGTWLTAAPGTGTTPANVQVSVNAGSLAPGSYTGTVTITSPGAAGSPVSIAVTFTVTGSQTLTAAPALANFSFILGTAAPAAQSVQLTSSGTNTSFTVAASTKDGGTWLSATPASGTTPAPLSIQVTPTGLAAGNYSGTVTVTSPNSTTPLSIPVTLTVTAVPAPIIVAVGNAASGAIGAVSPGENVTIFGTNIGPTPLVSGQLNAAGAIDNIAGDTQVFFDNVAAPVIYASAGQTSVMVPYGVAGRTNTTITVAYKGVKSSGANFAIVATAPGIYSQNLSGSGPGAIVNQSGSVVTASTPAPKGSVVAVYMTGEGLTIGNLDGVIATTLKNPVASVTATVGGLAAAVQYAGTAPGIVNGVMQVNVLIPANAPSGPAVPIVITVGTVSTRTDVTLAIQ